ncbi:hypothetical protein MTO96_007335 [Rhipicephalus appendiculatus]
MAVVMFVGGGTSDEPMKTNDACERAFMMDLDVTCNDTFTSGRNAYDQSNKYAFATFRHGGNRYFATYIRTFSDGWAMFEVQHDLWKACRTNDYIRLELVALGIGQSAMDFLIYSDEEKRPKPATSKPKSEEKPAEPEKSTFKASATTEKFEKKKEKTPPITFPSKQTASATGYEAPAATAYGYGAQAATPSYDAQAAAAFVMLLGALTLTFVDTRTPTEGSDDRGRASDAGKNAAADTAPSSTPQVPPKPAPTPVVPSPATVARPTAPPGSRNSLHA